VRKGRDVAHVDAGTDDAAALADVAQCLRHERADRCEQDCRVELARRTLVAVTRPCRAEASRERLRGRVAPPRERENFAPLMPAHLRDHVRGCAEAVDADARRGARNAQRTVADQSRAEPWSERAWIAVFRKRKTVACVRERVVGVSAVDRVAGEAREIAQVFLPREAISARAAGVRERRYAHALSHAEPA